MISRTAAASRRAADSSRPIADRVGETPCVFLAGLYRAERAIAERLVRPANGTLPWPWIDPDKALPWVEKRIGLVLAESQIAAIRLGGRERDRKSRSGPNVGQFCYHRFRIHNGDRSRTLRRHPWD